MFAIASAFSLISSVFESFVSSIRLEIILESNSRINTTNGSSKEASATLLDTGIVDYMSGHDSFKHKPGTAVVSARRAGTTATIDQLNKYFQINQMPIISGRYWNMVHGQNPFEAMEDKEGMQNMRILGKNFAYHLKCKEAAKKAGIEPPKTEEVEYTNFIR